MPDAIPVQALEDNETAFHVLHRSEQTPTELALLLTSPEKEVCFWNCAININAAHATALLQQTVESFYAERGIAPCFKVTPLTAPADLEGRLQAAGYRLAGTRSTMLLTGPLLDPSPSQSPEISIQVARSEDDIRVFTRTQIAGFDAPADFEPWFLETNRRNVSRPDHRYYIARINGEPVGVTLLLTSPPGVAGIYAVATLESMRGRGVATALMAQAVQDAHQAGHRLVSLMTDTGEYPEQFYEKLGFVTVYHSRFYTP